MRFWAFLRSLGLLPLLRPRHLHLLPLQPPQPQQPHTPQLAIPIAIIERASMPDQTVMSGTLSTIVQALEAGGPQGPQGMIMKDHAWRTSL